MAVPGRALALSVMMLSCFLLASGYSSHGPVKALDSCMPFILSQSVFANAYSGNLVFRNRVALKFKHVFQSNIHCAGLQSYHYSEVHIFLLPKRLKLNTDRAKQTSRCRCGVLSRLTLMISMVLLMYALDVALWAMDIKNVLMVVEIRHAACTLTGEIIPINKRVDAAQEEDEWLRLTVIRDVTYSYMILLGNFIIISRVFAFWLKGAGDRCILIFPCLLYAASVVVIATGLIGIKGWQYRLEMRATTIVVGTGLVYVVYSVFSQRSQTVGITLELYSLHQSGPATLDSGFAMQVYQFTTSSIAGLYPAAVVVLVHAQCSAHYWHSDTRLSNLHFRRNSSPPRSPSPERLASEATEWNGDEYNVFHGGNRYGEGIGLSLPRISAAGAIDIPISKAKLEV
ncbi:hypothetical protein BC835DRAFT_1311764 [Cytidiella melzeri]|nr:hypothetical protein BC835DRAFT_1311764 [Cytidiella melzeri]